MIEINLLPEGMRKKKKSFQMPEINLNYLAITAGIVALIIVVHSVLLLFLRANSIVSKNMTEKWEALQPEKEAVDLIRTENTKARKNVEAIEALMEKKILWSRKLNELSRLVVPGAWFTEISIGSKAIVVEDKDPESIRKRPLGFKGTLTKRINVPYLNIEGEVSSAYGEELAIIGKFIERLKSDVAFIEDFSDIELDSTDLHSIEGTDVMKFNISCYFRRIEEG